MTRRTLVTLTVAALALGVGAVAAARPAATPTLKGTVGPGFTISLKSNGRTVKTLKAGKYAFAINDKGNIHNFVLEKEKGGTFERTLTGVGFVGSKTVTIKLTRGTWKFYCAPHESSMNGTFTVK
jgi:plastocyanin